MCFVDKAETIKLVRRISAPIPRRARERAAGELKVAAANRSRHNLYSAIVLRGAAKSFLY